MTALRQIATELLELSSAAKAAADAVLKVEHLNVTVHIERAASAAPATVARAPKPNVQRTTAERGVHTPAIRRPGRQRFTDQELLDTLAKAGGMTCAGAAVCFGVSDAAMRKRLEQLVGDGRLAKGGDKKYRRAVAASTPAVN